MTSHTNLMIYSVITFIFDRKFDLEFIFTSELVNKNMEETRADKERWIAPNIALSITRINTECIDAVHINGTSYILENIACYDDDMRRITRCAHFLYENIHHVLVSNNNSGKI